MCDDICSLHFIHSRLYLFLFFGQNIQQFQQPNVEQKHEKLLGACAWIYSAILFSTCVLSPCFVEQVFLLNPPIRVTEGDNLNGSFSMKRNKENHRLMEVEFSSEIKQYSGQLLPPFRNRYFIEWLEASRFIPTSICRKSGLSEGIRLASYL